MKKIFDIIVFIIFILITSIIPIQFYIFSCEDKDGMLLGLLLFVVFVLPITLATLIIFFISQKWKIKKYLIVAVISNIFWWTVYIFVGIPFSLHFQKVNEQKHLEPYKIIVKEINDYKKLNNKYPLTLKEINIPNNIDSTKLDYKTYNNNNEYYFSSSNRDFETKFIYCTDEAIHCYCNPKRTREETIYKIDDGWLKYEHDFF